MAKAHDALFRACELVAEDATLGCGALLGGGGAFLGGGDLGVRFGKRSVRRALKLANLANERRLLRAATICESAPCGDGGGERCF